MKLLFKLIAAVMLLAAIFGIGYLAGSSRMGKVDRMLASVRSEMTTRVSGLEAEIHSLRFRMQLTSARDRLIDAENRLKERNFGMAEKELETAREALHVAAQKASKETVATLKEMESSIDGVIEIVRRSDPRARVKLGAIRSDLDRLIGRT